MVVHSLAVHTAPLVGSTSSRRLKLTPPPLLPVTYARSTFTCKRTSSSPSSPSSSPSAFAGRSRGSRCSRARPFWCHPSPLVAWSCGAVTVGQLANVVGGDVGPAAAPEQMMRRRKRARGKQPWRLAIAGLWRRGRHDDRSTDTPPTSGYRECSRTSEAGAGGTGCECGEDGRGAGGMTSRVRVNMYREGSTQDRNSLVCRRLIAPGLRARGGEGTGRGSRAGSRCENGVLGTVHVHCHVHCPPPGMPFTL